MHVVFEYSHPLPVLRYGGTERVLIWLMKALLQLGHRVSLIGHPESQVAPLGIQLIPRNQQDWESQIPADADILHFQGTPRLELARPFVVTIHGNGKPGETFHRNTVFISRRHAQLHSAETFVFNGMDWNEYPYVDRPSTDWKQFAFLAKASWKVKNLRDCIRACRNTNKNLHIAGGRSWQSWLFPSIHSYGMVADSAKLAILRSCDALLFPVRWEEPFGIAILEAYSQGLPVLGSSHGSLPELITEESGLICENFEAFEQAIREMPRQFEPKNIRAQGEARFSHLQMAREYLKCYERVLSGETLNRSAPFAPQKAPENLLPF